MLQPINKEAAGRRKIESTVSKAPQGTCFKIGQHHRCGQIHSPIKFHFLFLSPTQLCNWKVHMCVGWRAIGCDDHPLKKCNESAAKVQQRCKNYPQKKLSSWDGQNGSQKQQTVEHKTAVFLMFFYTVSSSGNGSMGIVKIQMTLSNTFFWVSSHFSPWDCAGLET